jgi:predicted P-loop ATPase
MGQERAPHSPGKEDGARKKTPCANPTGGEPGQAAHPAVTFLQLLGKDPAQTYFRAIQPGTRPKCFKGFGPDALARANASQSIYFVTGNSTTASGKGGGVEASDITACPALFVEWDDRPIEWQVQAWRELSLPEPTVQVLTGGKSVHCYWLLSEPMPPDQWRVLQARLIAHCGSDQKLKDPCRLMRLPGFAYINKATGKPSGQVTEVVNTTTTRYSPDQIAACLPAVEAPAPARGPSSKPAAKASTKATNLPPRDLQQIEAAAQFIPERVVGGDTYEECRNALCGCAAALAAIGLPEEKALELLADRWPDRTTAEQVLGSTTTRQAASFWSIAKAHGFDLKRPRAQQAPDPWGLAEVLAPAAKGQEQQQSKARLPASFQDLIEKLKDGWVYTEQGPRATRIDVGQLAGLIEKEKGSLLRFNEMTMYVEANTSHGWQAIKDAEMDSGYVLLHQKGWLVKLESVIKALCHVARQRSIHPVREYLLRIEQDTSIKPYNLDRVGPDMFRAALPLHAAMVRKWLIGAAARVLSPGCQMDYCLVLHSRQQGMLKTSALTELASGEWHTSTIPKEDKDFLLNVHSTWIYELAELESYTNKRAAGELKNTITTRADNFRVPYGRTPEKRKRPSVFCGSVNTDSFLRDETGNRRYWVIPIEGNQKLDIDAIKKHRDSVWKAAVLAYRSGELPMLSEAQETLSERQNDGFQAQDAWLEMLQSWMAGNPLARFRPEDPSPSHYEEGGYYTAAEILYSAGLKRPEQINNHDATRLGPLLRELGFSSKRVTDGESKVRRWTKDQPRTTWTTPDHPETDSGGPASSAAAQPFSDSGPPGPPEKSILREKADGRGRKQGSQLAQANEEKELLETSGGPAVPTAESASVCNGSQRTTCPSDSGGPSGGPAPFPRPNGRPTGTHTAPQQPALLPFTPALVGSGSDVAADVDDPWWPPRSNTA